MSQQRYRLVVAVVAAVAVLVAAGVAVRAAVRAAEQVSVLASWTGAEEAAFRSVLERFTEETGIDVVYDGTRAVSQVLLASVRGGSPPDLAILPNPGELASYGRQGMLWPIDPPAGAMNDAASGPRELWLETDGDTQLYAVTVKIDLKGLIWYRPRDWSEPPTGLTWEQLHDVVAEEEWRWCLGVASPPTSGWPGTDWIENILLRQAGAAAYERWTAGELAWTSEEVESAWRTWGETLDQVYGGRLAALLTEFGDAGRPMFDEPAGCHLDHQASFIMGAYEGYDRQPRRGADFTFIPFPGFSEPSPVDDTSAAGARPAVVSGDLAALFTDSAQARGLLEFLVTEGQPVWVDAGQDSAFSLSEEVVPGSYHSDVSRGIADLLAQAPLCFDASDLMPAALANAFHQAVLEFLHDPGRLGDILQNLQAVAETIEEEQWLEFPCG